MCDTFYVAPSAAEGGGAWFAKNSDRNPDEPQTLCLFPRAGGRSFATLLSKPSWMEGGEMGVNETGVAIGNEAVFPRSKPRKDGVLGMDILRAALEGSASAVEARDFIYANSFIAADRKEAYIIETAGRRWAWRRAAPFAAISNAYSIEGDYEGLDAATAAEKPASWRAAVENRFYLRFTKGEARRAEIMGILGKAAPAIGFEAVLSALRSHGHSGRPSRLMSSPCLHEAGFPVKSTTTASLVVEYLPAGAPAEAVIWFTGRPHPCSSVFVPLILAKGSFIPLWKDYDYAAGSEKALGYWREGRNAAPAGMRDETQRALVAAAAAAVAKAGRGESLGDAQDAVKVLMGQWLAAK
jgi:dipeptidase